MTHQSTLTSPTASFGDLSPSLGPTILLAWAVRQGSVLESKAVIPNHALRKLIEDGDWRLGAASPGSDDERDAKRRG